MLKEWLIIVQCFSCCLLLCSCSTQSKEPLSVGISPYQDVAMIVNIKQLGLEKKYNTPVELITMPWEEIIPALASAGSTIDVGFGNLPEFLLAQPRVNQGTQDPLVFVYTPYVFKSGSFITFNSQVPCITAQNINNPDVIKKFLSFKFGAAKNSEFEMMLVSLARRIHLPQSQLHIFDIPLNDGFLAARNGSLDATAAGLTQKTEAAKEKGKVVLTETDLGISDINGLICKSSTLQRKRHAIESLIRMWFDCTNFVFADINHNSKYSLDYLNRNGSTRYSLPQYKAALANEYFPRSPTEVSAQILSPAGKYSYRKEYQQVTNYLIDTGVIQLPIPCPEIIQLSPYTP